MKFLSDYRAPDYTFDSVSLSITAPQFPTRFLQLVPLVLDGSNLKLVYVKINGLEAQDVELTSSNLTLLAPPKNPFKLEIGTEIYPLQKLNNDEGLYYSSSNGYFVTQCESAGFSKITFYQDRPDVLAKFTVRIEASKDKFPVLLSNGNLVESGQLDNNDKHYSVWSDPFPKPCYLFALVAGKFEARQEKFTTRSGQLVKLNIWSPSEDVAKTEFAMAVLKSAMKWDEDVYGLEYDLDNFNVVSVPDAFMGAMENKSLNIFNAKFLLVSQWTSTDADIQFLMGIVAHEFFHNWTGNRVTCRDWFQISLKEGLTDFRELEFLSDMGCRSVRTIAAASSLRKRQFQEDSGPFAHPVRPASYVEVDNLYTATVYEKGAQVIGLYQTLLGKSGFLKGFKLYIERHDGHAATCEDFYQAMCDANLDDLSSFMLWYTQAGTPCLKISSFYNPQASTFTVKCRQETAPTPGQADKSPLLIPLAVGLLNSQGRDIPLSRVLVDGIESSPTVEHNESTGAITALLRVEQTEHEFTFLDVKEKPVPSYLRSFSAPVRLITPDLREEELYFLFANDSNDFNRWDAGQRIAKSLILDMTTSFQNGQELTTPLAYTHAIKTILSIPTLNKEFVALVITLPDDKELLEMTEVADPDACHFVRRFLIKCLATELKQDFMRVVKENRSSEPAFEFNPESKDYLASLNDKETLELACEELDNATNLTDLLGALSAISQNPGQEREKILASFYEKWKHERLVVNKWIHLQTSADTPNNVELVRQLLHHPCFDPRDVTKVSALLGGFFSCIFNFHAKDGSGYEFMADFVIEVGKFHPKALSLSLSSALANLWRFDAKRQTLAKMLFAQKSWKFALDHFFSG
ncbi:puromycin-sensitive aminopeptidase [Selaginella moellendorffii]|uniref:puromycin-sensitive aminopeptidase n=1 Tax=Selaginella moellendorffii TaxID=88036 RepID=UPI000D1C8D8D|nr:puromycin-sensitive aminopeptidase [Selaginella moellendorffii]|eukprot:XP_024538406.1 puromycin-sensitive aminopeptidase [Selaginella moellendorffii]